MIFAKRVFLLAGIYGILVLAPLYFLESRLNEDFPPPITHPEHFYGFVGVALTWQLVFLVISRDPVRYRALMLPAILEKLSFGIAVWALFLAGRVSTPTLGGGTIDLLLAGLFGIALARTARQSAAGDDSARQAPAS